MQYDSGGLNSAVSLSDFYYSFKISRKKKEKLQTVHPEFWAFFFFFFKLEAD